MARITNAVIANNVRRNLQRATERLENVQNQVASGLEIDRPSKDPARANRILSLRTSISQNEQFILNANHAGALLSVADGVYANVGDILFRARDLAHQALSGSSASVDLKFFAEELDQLVEGILDSANTDFSGVAIFAGNKTDGPPFIAHRETTRREIREFSLLNGIGFPSIRVATVEVEGNFAIGDIITLSDQTGASEQAEVVDIQPVGDESVLIFENPLQHNYLLEEDAKVSKSVGETVFEAPLQRDVKRDVLVLPLDESKRGDFNINDLIRIEQVRDDRLIFEEVLIGEIETDVRQNELTMTLTSPLLNNYTKEEAKLTKTFDIPEGKIRSIEYVGDGNTQEGRIGRTTFIPQTMPGDIAFERVFDQLLALRDALRSGGLVAIEGLIENLEDTVNHIAQLRTEVGGKIRRIETQRIRLGDITIALQNFLQEVEQVSVPNAVIDFETQATILEATMATGARVLGFSLFNFLA